jgi:DNA invertase Pin-like site-specific DNA recombinase
MDPAAGGMKVQLPPDHGDRIAAGLQRARRNGKTLGRPIKASDATIRDRLNEGWTQKRIRAELHADPRRIRRIIDAMAAEQQTG